MPFYIAPFPGQSYPPRYARHDDIRAYLGLGKLVTRTFGGGEPYQTVEAGKLPMDFSSSCVHVALTDGRFTTLYCRPGRPPRMGQHGRMIKSSAHRCFALCPDCAADVPAGRTHQHKCQE
jgi:hypothetical protein